MDTKFIYAGSEITISWTVWKNSTGVLEDFSKAHIAMLLHDGVERYFVPCTAEGGTVTGVITAELPEAVYDVSLVWVKNGPFVWENHAIRLADWATTRCICRARLNKLFAITKDSELAENYEKLTAEISISSKVQTYAYDGLDAYEIAVLKGLVDYDDTKWAEYVTNIPDILERIEDLEQGTVKPITDEEIDEVCVQAETEKPEDDTHFLNLPGLWYVWGKVRGWFKGVEVTIQDLYEEITDAITALKAKDERQDERLDSIEDAHSELNGMVVDIKDGTTVIPTYVLKTTYATDKEAMTTLINTKQDKLTAGDNVAISTSNVISVDLSSKADKATTLAGYGITDAKIANGVITLGTATFDTATKADKATTLAGYGITDAKFADNTVTLGTATFNPVKDTDIATADEVEAMFKRVFPID